MDRSRLTIESGYEAAGRIGEDRVRVIHRDTGSILVVADGAGGSGDGGRAADAVIEIASSAIEQSEGRITDCLFWQDLLVRADRSIAAEVSGETTAVVAVLTEDRVLGASVGDSQARLIDDGDVDVLTERQMRKPLIGDGRAIPMPFECVHGRRKLIVGSDGLFNYLPVDRIVGAVNSEAGVTSLIDSARLPSGALQDDIAVAVARWV